MCKNWLSYTDQHDSYSQTDLPSTALTYSFILTRNDSMILVPPADARDGRPLYHISISANPFLPAIYTTTMHKGATEDGVYIADFE
jgi:hypothetical protein